MLECEEASAPVEGYILVRIHVPELNVQKCLQFPRDQLVWDVKQQCLAALPKELKESFNYGLFCPPVNGKAGKFLDEERRLGDYPFNGPVGYLELKYKRRVYKMLNLDEKQLKALHTRANLRRLLDYVANGQVEKITKMCSKGLDPNFHCHETGETPLTLGTSIKKSCKVLMALVNGGAILDYRTRDGSTALHRAVERNSLEAVTTLLELGASPNYKDGKGLTPLYLAVMGRTDPLLCEGLLHDRATLGIQDLQGWQEIHQAARYGLVQHLEHLLFYGADMNARNASGNTPLHVCAVNSQESCARLLLFRGCDRDALNYANQTPYQVAVIAGNLELADVIQAHVTDNVVPFGEPPRYNPRRRPGSTLIAGPLRPPSPSPSGPFFSSAESSVSEASSDTGTQPSTGASEDNVSFVTDKSLGDTSDLISDSSGVGTATSESTQGSVQGSVGLTGTTVVCLENYHSNIPEHLHIVQGEIIEVTGATDSGLLEGYIRGQTASGLFPADYVQEVQLRGEPMAGAGMPHSHSQRSASRVQGRRESMHKHFATAPRLKKQLVQEARTVVLHRARKGFGFVLRGAKATSPLMELTPSQRCPALQYLDDVDAGGVADMAGLKKGDYLLAINGLDVCSASHEHVVEQIRRSGRLVAMTVVSPPTMGVATSKSSTMFLPQPGNGQTGNTQRQYSTLPRKMTNCASASATLGRSPAPLPPRRDPKTTLSVGRARARSMVAGLEGGGEKEEDDLCSTAKSSSAESIHQSQQLSGSGSMTPVQPRTASIRSRPTSSRITAAELEELFQRQQGASQGSCSEVMTSHFQAAAAAAGGLSQPPSPARTPRVYASVAEMKRSKGKPWNRGRMDGSTGGELHRDFHSTPDLNQSMSGGVTAPKCHLSQEDVAMLRQPLPPPTHPPPPPPGSCGQMVMVEISRSNTPISGGEYSKNGGDGLPQNEVVSSFRPANHAKLYASPEDVKSVGFRSRSLPAHAARPQVRKSHSLRTASSFKPSPGSGPCPAGANANPYAQPITRTQSSVKSKKKNSVTSLSSGGPAPDSDPALPRAPPIPEPDYSLSESESDKDEEKSLKVPPETSGTSTSTSSSGTLPHSFSVDEIQKVRTQLKSSKSYPNDFINLNAEDGDNSSSGVSSDQEVNVSLPPAGSMDNSGHAEKRTQRGKPPISPPKLVQVEKRGSIPKGKAAQSESAVKAQEKVREVSKEMSMETKPPTGVQKISSDRSHSNSSQFEHSQNTISRSNYGCDQSSMQGQSDTKSMTLPKRGHTRDSLLSRHAVSLAQLPPPLEGDGEGDELVVPPPPEFVSLDGNAASLRQRGAGAAAVAEEVLAPPPQFSDNRLVTRVRIVGATPKGIGKNGRLHSQ